MHIALLKNNTNSLCLEAYAKTIEFLSQYPLTLTSIEEEDEISPDQTKQFDVVIAFGGDGSLLHAVHRLGNPAPPLVGVNVGSLGFLAEIALSELQAALRAIVQKEYTLQELLILALEDEQGGHHFAVNEIALHRETIHNLVDLTVKVDGELFNTFSSDGLILSTPSGSTAYSLSAGGPIVAPSLDAVIITPICPHTISNRPVVLLPRSSIEISLSRGAPTVGIAVDGIHASPLSLDKSCHITISPHRFKLLSFTSYKYFQTLRQKLGWVGSLKNSPRAHIKEDKCF